MGSDSPIVFVPRPEDDPSVRRPDITLATAELGWQPSVGVEEGIRATVEWFRRHPDIVGSSPRVSG